MSSGQGQSEWGASATLAGGGGGNKSEQSLFKHASNV